MTKATYTADLRERLLVWMFENKGKTTFGGQCVIKSRRIFYAIMSACRRREPNPFIVSHDVNCANTAHNHKMYSLTWSGNDYAEKVKTMREAEGKI
jgi:hypothetical protein